MAVFSLCILHTEIVVLYKAQELFDLIWLRLAISIRLKDEKFMKYTRMFIYPMASSDTIKNEAK